MKHLGSVIQLPVKNLLVPVLLLLVFASCSHRIHRMGYEARPAIDGNCEVHISKFMAANDSIEKIGEITLGESGFSVSCSEAHALELLKKEACALQADVVNITSENRPDLWSSCYRCTAEFYHYKNPGQRPPGNASLSSQEVAQRVNKDRKQNTVVMIFAVVTGFAVGYLLFQ